MIFRHGVLLSFFAVFLQIAVFLQPLLPENYQISPVCETITRALFISVLHQDHSKHSSWQHRSIQNGQSLDNHVSHGDHKNDTAVETSTHSHNHHDANHQCQYCTVYANLVLPPEIGVKEVLERVQVRLLFFRQEFRHVYFVLQKLFLIPQGRAPPISA